MRVLEEKKLVFDVVIIGASTAGLYAAELLAGSGKRVAVFERQPMVDPARRTYIITSQLREFLTEIPVEAACHQTNVISVASPNANVVVSLRQPDLIVERGQLTQGLLGRTRQAGVELIFGHRFLRFEMAAGQAILVLENATGGEVKVTAGAVIGADGLHSQVAGAAGIPHPPSVPILQAEIDLPAGWDPAVTRVWFDVEATRFFYWLIPESDERGVLGLVGDKADETRRLLDRFMARLGLQALCYQGAQVAMHHPNLRPWGRVGLTPVYLIGDAAGQVKVTTVGGTVTGLWGARAAANAITKGTSYARELRSLKRELDVHWYIRLLLERLDNAGYDRLIECVTPSVQNFLSRRNRDQMMGGFWQLPFRKPRLALLGMMLLFKRSVHDSISSLDSELELEAGN